MVVFWECKAPGYKDITHEQKIVIYPHAIVYDFEAYLDKAKIYSATKYLTFENVHVPISVSVGELKFLDVINYLGPGTSYDKRVNAYGCKQTKSWFPYEWFDSPDKLA